MNGDSVMKGVDLSFGEEEHLGAETKLNVPMRIVGLLLLVWILFPPLRTAAPMPDIHLGFVILLLVAGWWSLRISVAAGGTIGANSMMCWMLAFGACIGMSLVAAVAGGRNVSVRDMTELLRLVLYLAVLTLSINSTLSVRGLERTYKLVLGLLLVSAIFGFAQYSNFADVNRVISPIFAPTQMEGLLRNRRITGTSGNPNEFGALMVLASCLALSWGLFAVRFRRKVVSGLLLSVFGLAMLLTSSRSALIVWVVSIGLLLFVLYPRAQGVARVLPAALLVLAVATAVGLLLPEEVFARVFLLRDLATDSSWQVRLLKWREAISAWTSSPLLGLGPAEETMVSTVDNEWILVLRRYGLVGLLVFIGMWRSLFASITPGYAKKRQPTQAALAVALQATIIGYAIYMVPASAYHSLQLMPILLLLVGLSISQCRNRMSCGRTEW